MSNNITRNFQGTAGHAHFTTSMAIDTQGRALVLYLLPEGQIKFTR